MRTNRNKPLPWLSLLALAAACGGPPPPPAPGEPPASSADPEEPAAPGAPQPGDTLPARLTCVSDVIQSGTSVPSVWRLDVTFEGETAELVRARGPQFPERGLGDEEEVFEAARVLPASVDDGLLRIGSAAAGFSLELAREGAFFSGPIVDGPAEHALLCWEPDEVLGTFAARFDPADGRCKDDEGNDARNEIPVAFARESGFGECANLSGQALNGEDYGYPQLEGWNLRGADLVGATLYFAKLTSASLEGADLFGIGFGYGTIQGTIDEATRLPEANCTIDETTAGTEVECRQ